MYMSQALNAHCETTTVFAKGHARSEDISEYYGLKNPPKLSLTRFDSRASIASFLRELARVPIPDLCIGRYVYGSLAMAWRRAPVVYEIHSPATGYKRIIEERLLRSRALVLTVFITEALRHHYLQRYPFLIDRSIVLADAANDPGEPEPPGSEGPLKIAYVGSFYEGRGIEMITQMAQTLPEMHFVAAGGSAQQLEAMGLDVPDNLRCLGYLAPAETASIMRSADVLLAPYQRKVRTAGNKGDTSQWMSPMKFFEYMAHGKALLCSDLPAVHEVLENEVSCLLLPCDSLTEWCNAIVSLDNNRPRARALGQEARKQFLEKHTWTKRAGDLLDAVQSQRANQDD